MTPEEFWEEWMPCDCSPVESYKVTKNRFMEDLRSVMFEQDIDSNQCSFYKGIVNDAPGT